jgi:hypothetical protein
MAARVNYLSGNVNASTTRAGHLAPMKDYLPDHHDDQRERDWQRREHNLNAEPGNGHRPSLWRRLILGVILGSFFFLVVSCFYWADLHVPKTDRAKIKFNHGDRQ